jgi:drug/metabolite transporter (DMT)-like permease
MVFAAAVMWSTAGILIKLLTTRYGMTPGAVACLRSAIGGLALAWALPGLRGSPMGRVGAASVLYTIVVGSFVLATAGTTAANAILLQYGYPMLVAVGAVYLFKERLGRRTVAALVLGMAGVATILVGSWGPGAQAGLALGAVSAIALAGLTLLQRSIRSGSPVAQSSLYNLVAGALLLPLAWGSFDVSAGALLLVAVMGILQLAVPYVLFIRGLRIVPATDVALITIIEPILNPLWVWLGHGEVPHWSTAIGGALILGALLVRFLKIRTRGEA